MSKNKFINNFCFIDTLESILKLTIVKKKLNLAYDIQHMPDIHM